MFWDHPETKAEGPGRHFRDFLSISGPKGMRDPCKGGEGLVAMQVLVQWIGVITTERGHSGSSPWKSKEFADGLEKLQQSPCRGCLRILCAFFLLRPEQSWLVQMVPQGCSRASPVIMLVNVCSCDRFAVPTMACLLLCGTSEHNM